MTKKDALTVLGYGSQGRALACNLHDSGYHVTAALRPRSLSRSLARRDGIPTATIPAATAIADHIIIAVPDHLHARVLTPKFFAGLTRRPTLVFLHASSIHFNLIAPPEDLPVLLLAPHAPGLAVRENYLQKIAYSAFVAVHQGPQRKGLLVLERLARAIGIPKTHLVKTTFADESIGDVFGEQAVLCGGLARLLKFGFEALVEQGLPPQNAYLEVAYQIDLIVSLVKQYGIDGMFQRISAMARYGSIVNGPRVLTDDVKKNMKRILTEITSGRFVATMDRTGLAASPKQYDRVTNALFDKQAKKFNRK